MARTIYPRSELAVTRWHTARSITEFTSDEIPMEISGRSPVSSSETVSSISTSYGSFITRETNSVLFSDWGLPHYAGDRKHRVRGIEMQLYTQRVGRIQDKTIQIWSGRNLIGHNQQNLDAENTEMYGGPNSIWGIAPQNLPDVGKPEFGVVIDLQPHTTIPCNAVVRIHSVKLRIWVLPD